MAHLAARLGWTFFGLGACTLAQAAPGDLDCAFGNGGAARLTFTTTSGLALQGAKFVSVAAGGGIVLNRVDAYGRPDTTFGVAGTAQLVLDGVSYAGLVAVDSQQRIVVAAQYSNGRPLGLVARFDADGAPDASFGNGAGYVILDLAQDAGFGGTQGLYGLAIDHEDRIVLGGTIDPNGNTFNPSNSDMAAARLATSGALDLTFNGSGIAYASSADSAHDDDVRAIAVDAGDRVVAIGSSTYPNATNYGPRNTIVARWNADGSLDAGFGSGGVAVLDLSQAQTDDFGIDVALDHQGRILALGQGTDDPLLARLLDNGQYDASFAGGVVQRSFVGGQDVVEHVLVQADDKVLVTGWPIVGGLFHTASMRFAADGSLDTSWGGSGVVTTNLGTQERAYSAALQADGKLVIAGMDGYGKLYFLRYLDGAAVPVATQTRIVSDAPNPSTQSELVTVAFAVARSGDASAPAPDGSVSVGDGVDSCSASVAAGQCQLVLHTGGLRSLGASFAAGACFGASQASAVAHVVKFHIDTQAGAGGSLSPPQRDVLPGASASFDLVPDSGYRVAGASGCGGSLIGASFTTAAVGANCSVTASFAALPLAQAGSLSTLEDTPQSGQLAGSGGPSLTFAVAQAPAHGSLENFDPDGGSYQYRPAADFNGSDSFQFTVNDGNADSLPAAVTIMVTPVNDAPALSVASVPVLAAGSSGAHSVPAFASLDMGPDDEDASQHVAQYLVDSVDDPDQILVAGSVSVDTDGTLHYATTGVGGSASVSLRGRDDGGTANGGSDTSRAAGFSLRVAAGADLHVALDDGREAIEDGDLGHYALDLSNSGPNAVAGAMLDDTLPPTLVDAHWLCRQDLSDTPCPTSASGDGDAHVLVDLPVGRHLRFDIVARANVSAGSSIVHTATLTTPAGVAALSPADDSASDVDAITTDRIFADDFE